MGTKYFINPVNVNYRYQFNQDPRSGGETQINREAADPSMIYFKGKYYIFASMTLGYWVSEDMVHWENHKLPEELPLYDYAPDVRVMNGYVYYCASKRGENCDRFRTQDIENGPYEKIEGNFPFWDPNVFVDDDGRVYFFWGCTNTDPIWGVELDPETMLPIGEKVGLIWGDPLTKGYERCGEDNSEGLPSDEEVDAKLSAMMAAHGAKIEDIPKETLAMARGMFSGMPYIEGAWLDKVDGKYYLQYANPGTQYNTYNDGVYVSDKPLGPYTLAANNPFSYKPGGFLPGAGHGSSMQDVNGNWWHTATMRISTNHMFERRVGIWPVGFDADGEMFCNQRYGDWPIAYSYADDEDAEGAQTPAAFDPWKNPEWFPLHVAARKSMTASSFAEGHDPRLAVEENVQTWWKPQTNGRDEWLMMDLIVPRDVRMIQINFGDDHPDVPIPGEIKPGVQARYIDGADMATQWKLLGSVDGENWEVLCDKSAATTDLTHDSILFTDENGNEGAGKTLRFLKLTDIAVPYGLVPCISGFRVFGIGDGEKPAAPDFAVEREEGSIDMTVRIEDPWEGTAAKARGFNILFGHAPDKLYHSYLLTGKTEQRIGALIKDQTVYVRVDAWNENGITEGKTVVEVK